MFRVLELIPPSYVAFLLPHVTQPLPNRYPTVTRPLNFRALVPVPLRLLAFRGALALLAADEV